MVVGEDHTVICGRDKDNLPFIATAGENNFYGQLAIGDSAPSKDQYIRCKLPDGMIKVNSVQISDTSTLIYGRNQENQWLIATAGDNCYGQLATGDNENKKQFTLLKKPIYPCDKSEKQFTFFGGSQYKSYKAITNESDAQPKGCCVIV
jgi:hypothetical protein